MDYQKPEAKAKTYWALKRVIGLLFLLLLLGVITLFMNGSVFFAKGMALRRGADIVMLLLLLLQIVSIVLLPAIEYRQWAYAVTEDRVEIRHGIFWEKWIVVPIVRIQNVTVKQGPMQRFFDLYSLELSLASDSYDIEGLRREVAEDISEKLRLCLQQRLEAERETETKA